LSEHLILVGRPSPEALEPLTIRLQNLGYTLSIAADEEETLRLLRARPPRGVLVDIAMPEINGVAVCRAVRRAADGKAAIIALNQGEAALRQAALEAGADLVLDEPINWADLRHWLAAPHTLNGHLLAEGALLGQTRADALGSAALLSHDLKSPISVIISSLEVMLTFEEEDGMPEATRRLLRGALSAAQRQLNLVSTLVDLPRLELGVYELQLAEVDLGHVVRAGLEKDAYTFDVKGLEVKLDLPAAPLLVQADQELLQHVVAALIDNTMKFTVRGDTLTVWVSQEKHQAVLRFTDSGRPIQPGFERDIMTRAPQWERRQAGARTSVALGLPFIDAVARAHGGDFSAGSTPDGRQTSFTFRLPVQQNETGQGN
jgi:signal transduction histidine kinase